MQEPTREQGQESLGRQPRGGAGAEGWNSPSAILVQTLASTTTHLTPASSSWDGTTAEKPAEERSDHKIGDGDHVQRQPNCSQLWFSAVYTVHCFAKCPTPSHPTPPTRSRLPQSAAIRRIDDCGPV
jgi:hypothetical protein